MQHPTNRCFRKRKQRRSFDVQSHVLLLKLGNEYLCIHSYVIRYARLQAIFHDLEKMIRVFPQLEESDGKGPSADPYPTRSPHLKPSRAPGRILKVPGKGGAPRGAGVSQHQTLHLQHRTLRGKAVTLSKVQGKTTLR